MPLPVFDSIELPPDATLVDVNTMSPQDRDTYQGAALAHWLDEEGEPAEVVRDWDPNEGIFAVVDNASGAVIGVAIILDVEGT